MHWICPFFTRASFRSHHLSIRFSILRTFSSQPQNQVRPIYITTFISIYLRFYTARIWSVSCICFTAAQQTKFRLKKPKHHHARTGEIAIVLSQIRFSGFLKSDSMSLEFWTVTSIFVFFYWLRCCKHLWIHCLVKTIHIIFIWAIIHCLWITTCIATLASICLFYSGRSPKLELVLHS